MPVTAALGQERPSVGLRLDDNTAIVDATWAM